MPSISKLLVKLLWEKHGGEAPSIVIAMGKGGVGKTTISILLGLILSEYDKTLIASLDPAKHMIEYLGIKRLGKPEKIRSNLWAIQYDIEAYSKKVGEDYALLLKRLIPGLTALNLDDVLKSVRDAPGFEEEVFLRILRSLYSMRDYSYVVVDTPPTGVSLRVLSLPRLYRFWISSLKKIRENILSLRYAISRVLEGKEAKVSDPVLSRLESLEKEYEELVNKMMDNTRTSLIVVATPEPLPVYEAHKVAERASDLGITLSLVVVNRVLGEKASGLGVKNIEDKALRAINELRCRFSPPIPLLIIRHAGYAPHSIGDVEKLVELAELRTDCQL